MFFLVFLGILVVFEGSGLFRKVREGAGIHFHQVSSKSELVGSSYDKKTENVNTRYCLTR